MSSNDQETVASPCIGVCAMSQASGLCLGCYRSLDEIRSWWDMPADERQSIMDKLEQREADNSVDLFGDE